MEWQFEPEQLVKGEVDYRLEDFRRDLAREVAANVAGAGEAESRRAYDLVYDLCYWLATEKPLAGLLAAFDGDPATRDWLAALAPHMRGNAAMLGAILQRAIMDRVACGDSLDAALQSVARANELAAFEPPVLSPSQS